MSSRLTAAQVLQRIQELPSDESGDDSSHESDNENVAVNMYDSSSSASSSDEEDIQGGPVGQVDGRDGTRWVPVDRHGAAGRAARQNVFTERVGVTRYCAQIITPVDAWRLLLDEGCIRHIARCTIQYAREYQPEWNIHEAELEKFIGLLYLRGAMNQRNYPLEQLWSKTMGCPAFGRTMPRDRMREIKKYLRFDDRQQRKHRLQTDKFYLISWVLDRFVDNSQKAYKPGPSLTVDEQLFPTKARCRFTQYMPNKPDKFGIKFWVLADLESKYCYNMIPYLGKDEQRTENLGTHVVMQLMEPLYNKGYNVTVDNFFTSKRLAELLLEKRTTITGTMKANRRELPPPKPMLLHETEFYQCDQLNLTRYQAKATKVVNVLSTQHRGAARQPEGKKKPESILYYNKNKCGVDMLDSMCRQMSTKAGCRRWPLAVFYNILDMAGVNAWILFCAKTGSKISRRKFMMQLSKELRQDTGSEAEPEPQALPVANPLEKRATCGIKVHCVKNKTVRVCKQCHKPVCGKCQAQVCVKCDEK